MREKESRSIQVSPKLRDLSNSTLVDSRYLSSSSTGSYNITRLGKKRVTKFQQMLSPGTCKRDGNYEVRLQPGDVRKTQYPEITAISLRQRVRSATMKRYCRPSSDSPVTMKTTGRTFFSMQTRMRMDPALTCRPNPFRRASPMAPQTGPSMGTTISVATLISRD